MPKLFRADFHIHSAYSMDCDMSPEKIISRCRETGINCIAIADHGNIEGALKTQSLAPFPVIIAEEILTPHGEIMGIFLKEGIPSGLSIEQAIARIKSQDALVCLPHPFDTFRGLKINSTRLRELAAQVDIIETFNARSPLLRASTRAANFARKHNIPGTAGSDAHTLQEIGNTFIEMPEFNGKEDFPQALSQGKIHRQRSSPLVHFGSVWARVKGKL